MNLNFKYSDLLYMALINISFFVKQQQQNNRKNGLVKVRLKKWGKKEKLRVNTVKSSKKNIIQFVFTININIWVFSHTNKTYNLNRILFFFSERNFVPSFTMNS